MGRIGCAKSDEKMFEGMAFSILSRCRTRTYDCARHFLRTILHSTMMALHYNQGTLIGTGAYSKQ